MRPKTRQSRLGIIIEVSRRRVEGWWGKGLAGRDPKAALTYEAKGIKARACYRCLPTCRCPAMVRQGGEKKEGKPFKMVGKQLT